MRLRFTIRELILATVIVALAWGWWLDHQASRKATQSVTYYPKYANAEFVCSLLQGRFFNEDVHVIVGPTSDAVFVRAPANLQREIKDRISLIDTPVNAK